MNGKKNKWGPRTEIPNNALKDALQTLGKYCLLGTETFRHCVEELKANRFQKVLPITNYWTPLIKGISRSVRF